MNDFEIPSTSNVPERINLSCKRIIAVVEAEGLSLETVYASRVEVGISLDKVSRQLNELGDIDFRNVLLILVNRWKTNCSHFINDINVTSLIALLKEGRKIESILNQLNKNISEASKGISFESGACINEKIAGIVGGNFN